MTRVTTDLSHMWHPGRRRLHQHVLYHCNVHFFITSFCVNLLIIHLIIVWWFLCHQYLMLTSYHWCLQNNYNVSQVWLATALTHIHQFLQVISTCHQQTFKNWLHVLTFSTTSCLLTLFCCKVKWRKWRVFHVTVIASHSWERCTAPVLPADCVTTGNGRKNGVHCGL